MCSGPQSFGFEAFAHLLRAIKFALEYLLGLPLETLLAQADLLDLGPTIPNKLPGSPSCKTR